MIWEITDLPKEMFVNVKKVQNGNFECWEWIGGKVGKGYGRIYVNGKDWYVHRYSYKYFKGDPGSLHVRHECDNKPCCNPGHLLLGTPQDNSNDAMERGLTCSRERNGMSKITLRQAKKAIEMYDSGMTQEETGNYLGISKHNVGKIVRGDGWGLRGGKRITFRERQRVPWKFTNNQAKEIMDEYLSGKFTTRYLVKKYNTSAGVINKIIHGEYR